MEGSDRGILGCEQGRQLAKKSPRLPDATRDFAPYFGRGMQCKRVEGIGNGFGHKSIGCAWIRFGT